MCTSASNTSAAGLNWVPASCTLPTVEQPIRVAEFDDLFTASVQGAERIDATTLRLTLAAAAEARARDLAGRESSCCSFFGFDFIPAGDVVEMTVTVPAAHAAVLDALAARITAAAGLGAPVAG
ncbi:hypothetical protein GCM10029976_011970 [Kribbella albertanoniae]|uniref:Arsenate reductase n=1 Tax=Kribbella albertanoniae TaxID=1266829 RepID=A0A4R4PW88_9ACTN|nr:hypothetical protein [Kribbella albertanoniae]TDC26553.1 hypothetical protein E1261_22275 [Kribbella albertanoniae]